METLQQLVIALDGENSTGKSSLARGLSKWLGPTRCPVLNTGQLYRSIALEATYHDVSRHDTEGLIEIAASIIFTYEAGQVCAVNGRPVTSKELDDMTGLVEQISPIPELRAHVRSHQVMFASKGLCIIEGRDIGSVVFPNAIFKVWLTCSIRERAKRMSNKLGIDITPEALRQRDLEDAAHGDGRLVRTPDAEHFDSTHLSVPALVSAVEAKMFTRYDLVPLLMAARAEREVELQQAE